MAGKSKAEREALERQNAAIMAVFERAGFDHIAPDMIQPADIFLERSGEDIRARTFVFTDPAGNEMCLRPDLTVPACRYHLSHASDPAAEQRYCYLGPAFRFPDERLSPQEFTQAGVEWFGAGDSIAAEARVLKLTLSALEVAGATGLKVTLGDLGLFSCLLDDMEMPDRWRRRLKHHFWRPSAFHDLLNDFANPSRRRCTSISPVVDQLEREEAASVARRIIEAGDLPMVGGRSLEEIAGRLAEKFADRSEQPIDPKMKQTIEAYLDTKGLATEVIPALAAVGQSTGYGKAVTAYERRISAFEDQGLNPRRFMFSATFGREIEYYTGFTFQIEAELEGRLVAVAGGGRYDNLLSDMGSPIAVSAVGSAIHTDRLMAVLA